ncbi:MAG: glycogen debranching enzyme family protein [Clostridia bacterium]|nr:glycogen debranching enzyme family protein [Clostridia bacterium]
MKFGKKQMNLEEGLTKEWIITNGIGGFASSTILNCNTRKYHGLLIAPLTPPARRFLILSKIDESIIIDNKKYNLYTNMGKDYISDGYQYQESFEKDYIPIFTYKIEDVTIKKLICMEYGKNTVAILYKIKNGKKQSKLTLAPIMNYRDFHQMNVDHEYKLKQEIRGRKVKIIIDDNRDNPIYLHASEGNYIEHIDDTFKNMFYIEEEKRGFYPEENHAVVGRYEIDFMPKEEKEISIVCSLEENIEEVNAKELISREVVRINQLMLESGLVDVKNKTMTQEEKDRIRDYMIATDNFVVYRPSFSLHTLIAGYPWFLDWGRDALISFEGLLLMTRRFDIAREVLLTFTKNIKFGLVPNGYSGFDNRPLYNSADASLLLFEQVKKYISYTNDIEFIEERIYPYLEEIINAYQTGIDVDDNNIYLDKDYLLVCGTPKTQNTWMDAKYGDFAVTPRNGKTVEMNSLWYNALKIMEELTKKFKTAKEAKKYAELAEKCKNTFEEKFYNPKRKCLYDVLGDKKIRPNQLFALALSYPVLEPTSKIAEEMMETVTKKLLNPYGLKTLAKGEENYIEVYEGEPFKRDMSYHQGITWPWLLGLYANSKKAMIKACKDSKKKKQWQKEYDDFKESINKIYKKAFYEEGMVGSIAELHDSKTPYLPKGALAQGWSVAEVFRIIFEK